MTSSKFYRRLSLGWFIVAGVCGMATLSLWLRAIWTVGDDSGRWAGTGVIVLVLAVASVILGIWYADTAKMYENKEEDAAWREARRRG